MAGSGKQMTTATKRATKKAKVTIDQGLIDESRRRVERATVRLVERGGQGVLVPGGFILTATHCINWCGTGMMALGEVYPAEPVAPTALTCRTSMAELHAL